MIIVQRVTSKQLVRNFLYILIEGEGTVIKATKSSLAILSQVKMKEKNMQLCPFCGPAKLL